MKMKKIFLPVLLIAGLLASCSDDDDNNNDNADLAGTYNLTSVMAPMAVDYNMDEIASQNLMEESPCYMDSYITLNANKTFTSEYNYVLFVSSTGCDTEPGEGTWDEEDGQLVLTNNIIEPSIEITYTINNDELLLTMQNAPYPDRDENNEPVYNNGTVILTYTKE
jgi:hypothetical protein